MGSKTQVGPNRSAAESTVAAMRESGALTAEHEATAVAFLSLATAVDDPDAKADLWREYRAIAGTLRGLVAGGSDDDTAAFLVEVRTPVRDAS